MPIKDLLAFVDTGNLDDQFLRDAIAFAEFHKASLSVVVLSALPAAEYALTLGPSHAFLENYVEAAEAKQARVAELAGATNVDIRTISDRPAVIHAKAAAYARYADMVLFGPADNYDYPPMRRETIESILFASGRPVLVLPSGHEPAAIDHVAIGWNATRESTHALRDAAGFAQPGARVDIVILDGKPSATGHGSEPGADIAHHLARHGFSATVVAIEGGESSDAEALVNSARGQGAGMLALGAYGRSRLREMILGGVTRDLLAGAPIPLLFSH